MKIPAAGVILSLLIGCTPASQGSGCSSKDADKEIKAAGTLYGICTLTKATTLNKSLRSDTSVEEIVEKAMAMCVEERDFYRMKLDMGMSSIIKTKDMADKISKGALQSFEAKNKEVLIKTINNARTKEL